MIDLALYLAFVGAVTILMLIPGPNVALIVANSVGHGTRYGLMTVAGTASAMVLQLGLTILGMSAALGLLGQWFEWLRWAGVLYLLYLGIRQWRMPPVDLTRTRPEPPRARVIYGRAFLVSLTNPKTLLFYGAFFPQFVRPGDTGAQLALLAVTFLMLALIIDGLWALLAGRARGFIARRGRLRQRLSGGLLVGAGIGLALAHRR
ncbi:MAG TPA: LysE family translocator [Aliidongia sp.]|nr:LysE family translocator [Aliidongia sp.]